MNPTKSFLGVANGKFLGFVGTYKRIHLDPEKVHAIQEMQPPRNLKELRELQGLWPTSKDLYQIFQDVANPSLS